MSTRALVFIFVAAIVLLGAVGVVAQNRPGETMPLWEYKTEVTRADTRRDTGSADVMLNARGQQGWELVGMTRREIRVEDSLQTETIYTFKRILRSVNR